MWAGQTFLKASEDEPEGPPSWVKMKIYLDAFSPRAYAASLNQNREAGEVEEQQQERRKGGTWLTFGL